MRNLRHGLLLYAAALALCVSSLSCGSSRLTVDQPPTRLTAPTDAYLIPLEDPNWREVCIEIFRPFDGDALGPRLPCVTVGELRQIVRKRYRAD